MNATHALPPPRHHLAELRDWLASSLAQFRRAHDSRAVNHFAVAQDITRDVIADSADIARAAHSAETSDREAVRLLDQVLADGRVAPAEMAELRRARSLAARSAETDHDISESTLCP